MTMLRYSFCVALALTLCTPAAAKDQTDAALDLSRGWQDGNAEPIEGPDGRVLYLYGRSQPQLVCAPFRICDVALEPGEVIQKDGVKTGDGARWIIDGSRVGTGADMVEHVLVKPEQSGLRTSLFIATDRRSYMIELLSSEGDYTGQIGFLYGNPGSAASGSPLSSGVRLLSPPEPVVLEPAVAADPRADGHEVLGANLNFAYRIVGPSVPWRPVRVYDDGVKTFVDLDRAVVDARELPVLLVNDTGARDSMVNVRYANGRFVVDRLFDNASLVIGKGWRQKRVRIERTGRSTPLTDSGDRRQVVGKTPGRQQ